MDKDSAKVLIDGLAHKFQHMDALIQELAKRDDELVAELNKLKKPFIDPATGKFNGGAQSFDISSPPRQGGFPQPQGDPRAY